MKMIDIRWVKNSKTKGSSFKLVDRVPYNDYPSGTATVELTRIKEKTPDAKIHFRFPIKKGKMNVWDWKNQKTATEDVNWDFKCMVDMIFNEVENDYDYYFNFFNGKNNARINDKEIVDMIAVMQVAKKDLNNLLTVNNFSK
tara:strand:- start:336 stop:761 length:426 start_codon:yes stop_codon:yes gene_type:complete